MAIVRDVVRAVVRPVVHSITEKYFNWAAYWATRNWGNYFCLIKTIYTNKDTLIGSNNPTYNYGSGLVVATGEYNSAVAVTRTLIDFDLTSIEDVYRLKRSWVEGTKTGGTPADGATWNTYDGSNNWTTAGAFDPIDCEQVSIGEFEIAHDMANQWISIPLTVTSKAELTLGYGFLLKMEVENNDGHLFHSNQVALFKPYLKYEVKQLINGTVSPLLTKNILTNPFLNGYFGSIVYNSISDYIFYYCLTDGSAIKRATSDDGQNWTITGTVLTPIAGVIDVCMAWKESGTYYMLYRSNEWGGNQSIGLATSSDGITWNKSGSNPILTNTDIGAWCTGNIDPWGIIKVGAIYYLWINDVSEVPRQTGLATSTDLINWTMNPSNPIFDNGRYCVTPIKYIDKYYLFVPYTPEGNVVGAYPIKYRIEIYRNTSPTFLSGEREYLGNILIGGEDGEWDDDYLDTPSILTTTIQRNVFPAGNDKDGKLWMYYTGHAGLNTWNHGLAIGHLEMLPLLDAITEPGAGE
jgi:hypothetical protein